MALIRQANAATMTREAIVLDLGDIMRQGELIRTRAQHQADEIISAARAERERLIGDAAEVGRRDGHARGLEEGRAEGLASGREAALAEFREKLSGLEGAWTAALARFEHDRDDMLLQARRDVLRLAVKVGELVTKRAIEVHPEVVEEQLAAVLGQVSRPTRLTIRLHPDDHDIAQRALPAVLARAGAAHQVEVVTDPVLDRGSVIATTGAGGEIDASIRTQLDRIVTELMPDAPRGNGP